MNTDPFTPPPAVDHPYQSRLAAQMAAMMVGLLAGAVHVGSRGHLRSGITKNKGCKRNKSRVRMAKESRRRNRVR